MTRKTLLAATVLAAAVTGGAAIADSNHGHRGQPGPYGNTGMMMQDGSGMMGNMGGMSDMMGMMKRMHGQMMGGDMMGGMGSMGGGIMGGMGPMGGGMMGGMGPMGGRMMQMFDADGDGTVTPEEMRAGLQAKLAEYDSDGDGSLSIAEFEALHSAMIRETMVDRFQYLDADGDGLITAEEMGAPADKMERMQKIRDRMGPMQPGAGRGKGRGSMMNDD